MEILSAFLPVYRRHALNAGNSLPDRVIGAALFADISGFTPLTTKLAHELGSRRGAEELIGHLNRVFSALIAEVHRFHGDVVSFSGDAFTCWFDEADLDISASARAVACGLELQSVMGRLGAIQTRDGVTTRLGLKVAVAAGTARRFLVGDPASYVIEVLAGATLDRMATAESLAERGELIASSEVLARIHPPPKITGRRVQGNQRFVLLGGLGEAVSPPAQPKLPIIDRDTARPWLLPPVYARLSGREGELATADFLADLRPSVALFLRFSGIEYDEDVDAGMKLDVFVRGAQAVLNRYDGYLLQLTMGDKGSYMYASFGAPIAHENDAARAAAAALELRELTAVLGYLDRPQIGISRGLVHSGAYGSPERRAFGVIGNEVNITARLMTTAQPGQVLVSSQVAEALGSTFGLRELAPVTLKGVQGPFAVWELRGRHAVSHVAPKQPAGHMVGREAELSVLNEAVVSLARGESSALLIEGEAGVGKSLLIEELMQRASAHGSIVVLVGNGDAIEQSTPYHAWQSVWQTVLTSSALGGQGQAESSLADHVLSLLDPNSHQLAPLLNVALPLDLPQTELTEQMTGEARQEATHQLLTGILRAAVAGRPLCLIFDDVHWLDSASWALIRHAQREIEPILILMAGRPVGDDAAVYGEVRSLPSARRMVLNSLPPAAIEELVARRLGMRRIPPALAQLIRDKAEGNPFFSEELAYALRDAGIIQVVDGEGKLAPGADLASLDFPNTIQGVITSRIDLLAPAEQLTVKVASVIGRIFGYQLLHDTYPVGADAPRLREYLGHLARLDITPLETPEPNLAYIFRHILTQEVVYTLMTFAQKQQLHRSVAEWYTTELKGDPNRLDPLLAHHWRLAGETERAVTHYARAGERAFGAYANQEAIGFLTQALELAGDGAPAPQRARWHRLVAEAAYRLTQIEMSQTQYGAALEALGRPLPRSSLGRGLGLGRQMVTQLAHRLVPGRLVSRASREEAVSLLESSRALENFAENFYNTGDFLTAFLCVMSAFNLAERAGPSPELVRGYANMCATFGTVSLHSLAESYRARALAVSEDIHDLLTEAWIQIPLATYSLWIGAWERAEVEIAQALAIYARLGEWRRWCVAAWLWPQVAQGRGELTRASDLWADLLAVAERSRDTRHLVRGRGGQFFNYLSLGESAKADACAEAVRAVLDENPEMLPVEERLWYGISALRALRQGDWQQARELVHQQEAAINRARFKFDLLHVFTVPAEVFLTLWENGEATSREAQRGCRVLAQYARTYAFARPRALRYQGRYVWLTGNPDRARTLWNKSLAQADSLQMPHERELTLAEIDRLVKTVDSPLV